MRLCIINHALGSPEIGPNMRHWYLIESLIERGRFSKITGLGSRYFHKYRVRPPRKVEGNGYSFIYLSNIRYTRYFTQIINHHIFALRVALWCKRNWRSYDVFYFSSPPPLAMFYSRLFVTSLRKKIVLFEFRDMWPEILYSLRPGKLQTIYYIYLRLVVSYCYQKCDRIFCVKQGEVDYINERYAIELNKIVFMPNSSPAKIFKYEACQEHSAPLRFVYVGALSEYYDLELFFNCLPNLDEEKYIVDIYGEGLYKSRLEKLIVELGLSNVRFLGYRPKSFLEVNLKNYDYGLLFLKDVKENEYGISTNKVFDYANAGLPIIASYNSNYGPIECYGIGYNCKHSMSALTNLLFDLLENRKVDNFSDKIRAFLESINYTVLSEKFESIIDEL